MASTSGPTAVIPNINTQTVAATTQQTYSTSLTPLESSSSTSSQVLQTQQTSVSNSTTANSAATPTSVAVATTTTQISSTSSETRESTTSFASMTGNDTSIESTVSSDILVPPVNIPELLVFVSLLGVGMGMLIPRREESDSEGGGIEI